MFVLNKKRIDILLTDFLFAQRTPTFLNSLSIEAFPTEHNLAFTNKDARNVWRQANVLYDDSEDN